MKKLQLVLILLMGAVTFSFAQAKTQKSVVINTPTLQCEQCKLIVENYLAKEEGVIKYAADYKRKQVKVTYWTDRTTVENVRTAIANAGFDADNETANPESYKKLPKCCMKTADAGPIPMDQKKQ
ncbi:heavy-metal-associated domain-containing protein [Pinibacter aurantiacus]|uniref:Heavy-metal-associated domain-containing protein n=1 Tax=Pinibacter aurantiacus TaxID=2851599 RepID=A0A9E2W5B1_9BACT|nr:heavy-metal-associated domain-containing protein [Pinibacter aurantiacus]MBV4358473.1 heavy-metal-associated domain-containing protein [Pinibacter aurantiacus]